jgi:hypothetical protein
MNFEWNMEVGRRECWKSGHPHPRLFEPPPLQFGEGTGGEDINRILPEKIKVCDIDE